MRPNWAVKMRARPRRRPGAGIEGEHQARRDRSHMPAQCRLLASPINRPPANVKVMGAIAGADSFGCYADKRLKVEAL